MSHHRSRTNSLANDGKKKFYKQLFQYRTLFSVFPICYSDFKVFTIFKSSSILIGFVNTAFAPNDFAKPHPCNNTLPATSYQNPNPTNGDMRAKRYLDYCRPSACMQTTDVNTDRLFHDISDITRLIVSLSTLS